MAPVDRYARRRRRISIFFNLSQRLIILGWCVLSVVDNYRRSGYRVGRPISHVSQQRKENENAPKGNADDNIVKR